MRLESANAVWQEVFDEEGNTHAIDDRNAYLALPFLLYQKGTGPLKGGLVRRIEK